MLTDLTPVELRLIDAARRGEVLECSDLGHDQLRVTTDPSLLMRGEVVRELLLGRHRELDPRGVQVVGARITGKLDLQSVTATQGLGLYQCVVDQPSLLGYAHLPWLNLSGTCLPALDAEGMRVDGNMFLRWLVACNDSDLYTVNLLDAHIGGGLYLDGAELTADTGCALNAGRLKVDGGVFLNDKFTATGKGELGAVNMRSANIGSELNLQGARLINTSGPALDASGALSRSWRYRRTASARESRALGRTGWVWVSDWADCAGSSHRAAAGGRDGVVGRSHRDRAGAACSRASGQAHVLLTCRAHRAGD